MLRVFLSSEKMLNYSFSQKKTARIIFIFLFKLIDQISLLILLGTICISQRQRAALDILELFFDFCLYKLRSLKYVFGVEQKLLWVHMAQNTLYISICTNYCISEERLEALFLALQSFRESCVTQNRTANCSAFLQ